MYLKNNSNKFSLISGLVFFIFGLIVFINPDVLVKIVSYGIGGFLILIGLYKCINYYIHDKQLGVVNRHELAFGITAIILGILFIFLAGVFEFLLRLIVGGWLVTMGISKIFKTFFTTERNYKFYSLIVIGALLIIIGLYIILVANIALSIIGLFMMLYGLIDFISFFVYREKDQTINDDFKTEKTKKLPDVYEVEFEEKEE